MSDIPEGNIVGEFPIGDSGHFFITADWVPDPKQVEQTLLRLSDELEDWSAPLAEARGLLIRDTELHFTEQRDPYGNPWIPLSENYLNRKQREGAPDDSILIRTSNMRDAATSEDAWLISERDIVFNPEALPRAESDKQIYGIFHQAGSQEEGNALATSLVAQGKGLTSEQALQFTSVTGKGKNLPRRMFVGVDEGTEDEIAAIFTDFLNRTVDIGFIDAPVWKEDLGMGTNKFGTFSIIGFLPTGQPRLVGGLFGRNP